MYLTYFLIFFMHSSDCFHVLTIVNSATVNIRVWLSLWDHDFFCVLPRGSRRKMAGSYRSSVFNFLKVKWKWKLLSHVQLFVTPWANTVHGILQARILEWVAFPFSKGSSQPRGQTQVSHMVGRFFTSWAIREVLIFWGPSAPFSAVSIPVSFPSTVHKSSLCFTSLLTLTNLSSFWWQPFWLVRDSVSLWFWFAFLWCLVMLNFFSHACWPIYMSSLEKCIFGFSAHFLTAWFACLFVFDVDLHESFMFEILTSYKSYHLQILSPIQ